MKSPRLNSGITLLEVMVVVFILSLLLVVLLPMLAKRYAHVSKTNCVTSMRHIGLAFREWAIDHNDNFPWHVSTNNGGTLELNESGGVWPHFTVMSNELGSPKVLVCPAQSDAIYAEDFDSLGNSNISYLVGLGANDGQVHLVLSGDSDLTTNGVEVGSGILPLSPNLLLGWSNNRHYQAGNIGLPDGSVQQFSDRGFQEYLRENPQTNRLVLLP